MIQAARKLFLALLASTLVAFSNASAHPETVPADIYSYACRFTSVMYDATCVNLPAPRISYVPFAKHTAGRYVRGADFIFVTMETLEWISRDAIFLHETIHYILSHKKPLLEVCESEEAARRAEAVFSNKRYTNKWRGLYGC